jgi:hypothetical protein
MIFFLLSEIKISSQSFYKNFVWLQHLFITILHGQMLCLTRALLKSFFRMYLLPTFLCHLMRLFFLIYDISREIHSIKCWHYQNYPFIFPIFPESVENERKKLYFIDKSNNRLFSHHTVYTSTGGPRYSRLWNSWFLWTQKPQITRENCHFWSKVA